MSLTNVYNKKIQMRMDAIQAAEAITRSLQAQIPELVEVDAQLQGMGLRIMNAAVSGMESLEDIRKENQMLLDKRAELLKEHGYSPDADSPVYQCKICSDSGYDGMVICQCVQKERAREAYLESGLGKALYDKSFDNFNLKYYMSSADTMAFDKMRNNLESCKKFAADFDGNGKGLLFIGGTGLGKTHLSSAIAKEIIAKGYYVVYESAKKLFDCYDDAKYNKDARLVIDKYENSDFLMIDDLGAENITQNSVSSFYSLLNHRIINSKPMLVSTNLTPPQISKSYGERISSRLLGEMGVIHFTGKDVRLLKVSEKA